MGETNRRREGGLEVDLKATAEEVYCLGFARVWYIVGWVVPSIYR